MSVSELPYAYLDHAASSPLVPAALAAMRAYDAAPYAGANPNSLHTPGRLAFRAVEESRASFAHLIGARRPSEIIWTGGGTESNNMAIRGLALAAFEASRGKRRRVLVSAIEHSSALDPARALVRDGRFSVEEIPCDHHGLIDTDRLERMLSDDVALVVAMLVNNETGVIQPVKRVVELARSCGALTHTDAVQALGHIDLDIADLGVDSASFAAHKVGGPVGVGALYLKSRSKLQPLIIGGGQEAGLRSGTVDCRGAGAFVAATSDAIRRLDDEPGPTMAEVLFSDEGAELSRHIRLTVDPAWGVGTVGNILHVLVPGHSSESLILGLDRLRCGVSGGSACSSSSLDPSHVLLAMGINRQDAFCALRISVACPQLDDSSIADLVHLRRALLAILEGQL